MDVTPEQLINVATHVVAIASVIAAVTPTPADNAVLIVARKALDFFALNILGAKNAAQVDADKIKR
jgi:hypothetical protein